MGSIRLAAVLLPLALLLGCASYSVNYDYDVTTNYSQYKTFDYTTAKKGTRGTTQLMDKRVRASVEKELLAKGFVMETKADPDFLVTYYPIVEQKKYRTTTHVGMGWGYRPMVGHVGTSVSQTHKYKEGTIVIEIVDFKSNQMIWQGAAVGALTNLNTAEEADEVVPKAVRDILSKFPPR